MPILNAFALRQLSVVVALTLGVAKPLTAQITAVLENPREVGRREQERFETFRRANLPPHRGRRPTECQELVGTWCYWYDETTPPPPPESPLVTQARDRLLDVLDSLGAEHPADNWIIGQRIRYLNEAGRDSAAHALAVGCTSFGWWCDALRGFTLHALGRYADAEVAYDRALAAMTSREQCSWRDLSLYLDEDARKIYAREPCGSTARATSEARIWWYARTRYGMRGNDSRTEHFARLTYVEFLRDAPSTYRQSFDDNERELLLRFGWPVSWSRGAEIYPPPGGGGPTFQIIGHDPTPSHRFIPPHHIIATPTVSDSTDWAVQRPPVVARYHPPYATSILMLEHQQALFRRGDSALVVLAYDVRGIPKLRDAGLSAALVLTPGRTTQAFEQIREAAPARGTLTAMAPWGPLLMSAEVHAPSVQTLVRARYGIRPPYAVGARVSLSDLLFFAPAESLPTSVEEVLPLTLPTQRLRAAEPLGVYWEAYNTNPEGETMEVSLTVAAETEAAGLLTRGLRALRLAREAAPVSVSVTDRSAAGSRTSPRALQLDISTLRPGTYLVQLEISVNGQYTIRADRRIVVIEP